MTKIHAESIRGFKGNVDILNQINENEALKFFCGYIVFHG